MLRGFGSKWLAWFSVGVAITKPRASIIYHRYTLEGARYPLGYTYLSDSPPGCVIPKIIRCEFIETFFSGEVDSRGMRAVTAKPVHHIIIMMRLTLYYSGKIHSPNGLITKLTLAA